MLRRIILVLVAFLILSVNARAQSTAFTYQGRLTDNGIQPSGSYDMEFRLFDALEGGNQQPQGTPMTITLSGPQVVPVANGVFTVQLDFGRATAFDGNPRWLQIAVKKPTDSSFIPLTPRQPVSSTPYAIRSLTATSADMATNSSQLGGVAASQYVVTTDPRMSDERTPTAGSGNYIQNGTSTQTPGNFNLSGNGTVGGTLLANTISSASLTSPGPTLSVNGSPTTDFFNIQRKTNVFGEFRANFGVFTSSVDTPSAGELSLGNIHATNVKIGGGFTTLANVNIAANSININSGAGGSDSVRINGSTFQGSIFTAPNVRTSSLDGSSFGGPLNIGEFQANSVVIHKPTTVSGLLTANSGISTNTETISGDLTVSGTINGTVATANNATNLGGVAASQYVQTTDPRMTDARSPLSGSDNYIRNTSSQQPANFNISGNATIRGSSTGATLDLSGTQPPPVSSGDGISAPDVLRVVGAKGGNTSADFVAGGAGGNVLIQAGDGGDITENHTQSGPGGSITLQPGAAGASVPVNNQGNPGNVLLAPSVGRVGVGNSNPFYKLDVIDSSLGLRVATDSSGGVVASFGGTGRFEIDKPLVIGGRFIVKEDGNVGIGTPAPSARLHIMDNSGQSLFGNTCGAGYNGLGFAASLTCQNYSLLGNGSDTIINRATGGSIAFRENNQDQMRIAPGGKISIITLGSAGSNHLCINVDNEISSCSSSLRYKTNVNAFSSGLSLVKRLAPITFDWKQGGMKDLGLGAEDVEKIEPLLVTYNNQGQVEGVKYDRVGVVLINAINEQQTQIEDQQTLIQSQQRLLETQQQQIDALKRLVCATNQAAAICKN